MIDPADIGRITPEEQADALRTLLATFSTAVVRPGAKPPRNAVSVEILDILDEVPPDRAEGVAQLFSMMALRLRRRGRPRSTAFRQVLETALLVRSCAGRPTPADEPTYLATERPGIAAIDAACGDLLARIETVPAAEHRSWLMAQALAAALADADADRTLGGAERDSGDLAVAEFLLRAAAQYLAGTAAAAPRFR